MFIVGRPATRARPSRRPIDELERDLPVGFKKPPGDLRGIEHDTATPLTYYEARGQGTTRIKISSIETLSRSPFPSVRSVSTPGADRLTAGLKLLNQARLPAWPTEETALTVQLIGLGPGHPRISGQPVGLGQNLEPVVAMLKRET